MDYQTWLRIIYCKLIYLPTMQPPCLGAEIGTIGGNSCHQWLHSQLDVSISYITRSYKTKRKVKHEP